MVLFGRIEQLAGHSRGHSRPRDAPASPIWPGSFRLAVDYAAILGTPEGVQS